MYGTGRKSSRKTQPKITVKYSAARLHEKGVVLEIEGLPHSQYVITTTTIVIISIIIMWFSEMFELCQTWVSFCYPVFHHHHRSSSSSHYCHQRKSHVKSCACVCVFEVQERVVRDKFDWKLRCLWSQRQVHGSQHGQGWTSLSGNWVLRTSLLLNVPYSD